MFFNRPEQIKKSRGSTFIDTRQKTPLLVAGRKSRADRYVRFNEITSNEDLLDPPDRLNWDFDAIIPGTGFECVDPKGYRMLNNRAGVTRSISNKMNFGWMMESLGFPHPKIYNTSYDFEYPAMIKPVYGAGKIENRLAHNRVEVGACRVDTGMMAATVRCYPERYTPKKYLNRSRTHHHQMQNAGQRECDGVSQARS